MIKKKSFTAAFTLIELLVVITIIGILAGIVLPVFNSVQTKGLQTKCLASSKQIGLALKLFAGDNNSSYPTTGVPTGMTVTTSNNAFLGSVSHLRPERNHFLQPRCDYLHSGLAAGQRA